MSGCIWKAIALYAEGCGQVRFQVVAAPICAVQDELKEYRSVKGGDNSRSIGSTVSDAIVRGWLWSTVLGVPIGLL